MPRPNSRYPKQSPAALLGQRLRRLRQAAGFASQEAGARAMGYAREVVTKAESGERVPTDQVFRKYLETFLATPGQAKPHRGPGTGPQPDRPRDPGVRRALARH